MFQKFQFKLTKYTSLTTTVLGDNIVKPKTMYKNMLRFQIKQNGTKMLTNTLNVNSYFIIFYVSLVLVTNVHLSSGRIPNGGV